MKAIAQEEFGPPDILELREVDKPRVGTRTSSSGFGPDFIRFGELSPRSKLRALEV
jgi:hypothetical protein